MPRLQNALCASVALWGLELVSGIGARYFGFYSADLTVNAEYSNLYQASSISDVFAAKSAGQNALLLTYDTFFTSTQNRMILQPDYVSRWASLATEVAPLVANGTLFGFNMGDEVRVNMGD